MQPTPVFIFHQPITEESMLNARHGVKGIMWCDSKTFLTTQGSTSSKNMISTPSRLTIRYLWTMRGRVSRAQGCAYPAASSGGEQNAKQAPPGGSYEQRGDEDARRHRQPVRPASQEEIDQGECPQSHGVIGACKWGWGREGDRKRVTKTAAFPIRVAGVFKPLRPFGLSTNLKPKGFGKGPILSPPEKKGAPQNSTFPPTTDRPRSPGGGQQSQ